MNYTEENSADGDNPAIIAEKILKKWRDGKSLIDIAEEMNLKIAEVKQILKATQKSLVQEGKVSP